MPSPYFFFEYLSLEEFDASAQDTKLSDYFYTFYTIELTKLVAPKFIRKISNLKYSLLLINVIGYMASHPRIVKVYC
jgi:hypothetical protein